MLLKVTEYGKLDERKLMDVYAESNFENTDFFFPDVSDKNTAVKKVEEGFLDFLMNVFFRQQEDASYWVIEENGVWVSALRTCRVEENTYYLEALETRPDQRKKGYASLLLSGVVNEMNKNGAFRLCDCVGKKNTASVKTHIKCGFKIVSEKGYDCLSGEFYSGDYGMEYSYSG